MCPSWTLSITTNKESASMVYFRKCKACGKHSCMPDRVKFKCKTPGCTGKANKTSKSKPQPIDIEVDKMNGSHNDE
jgi:hypothetical protein